MSIYGITIKDGDHNNIFIVEGDEAVMEKFDRLAEIFPYDNIYVWDYKTGVVKLAPNIPGWVDIPIASIIEKEFGYPQDIEGGLKDNNIYLWQSRNIV